MTTTLKVTLIILFVVVVLPLLFWTIQGLIRLLRGRTPRGTRKG